RDSKRREGASDRSPILELSLDLQSALNESGYGVVLTCAERHAPEVGQRHRGAPLVPDPTPQRQALLIERSRRRIVACLPCLAAQVVQRERGAGLVAEFAIQSQALLKQRAGCCKVALVIGQHTCEVQRLRLCPPDRSIFDLGFSIFDCRRTVPQ